MNQVNLIGRITKDVELNLTLSKQLFARFTLAVNRRNPDEADFISCVAWNKTAQLMQQYIHKGDRLGITGHIRTGSYDRDGHKVYTTDVIVDELTFIEKKGGQQDNSDDHHGQQDNPPANTDPDGFMSIPEALDEELPFV